MLPAVLHAVPRLPRNGPNISSDSHSPLRMCQLARLGPHPCSRAFHSQEGAERESDDEAWLEKGSHPCTRMGWPIGLISDLNHPLLKSQGKNLWKVLKDAPHPHPTRTHARVSAFLTVINSPSPKTGFIQEQLPLGCPLSRAAQFRGNRPWKTVLPKFPAKFSSLGRWGLSKHFTC